MYVNQEEFPNPFMNHCDRLKLSSNHEIIQVLGFNQQQIQYRCLIMYKGGDNLIKGALFGFKH